MEDKPVNIGENDDTIVVLPENDILESSDTEVNLQQSSGSPKSEQNPEPTESTESTEPIEPTEEDLHVQMPEDPQPHPPKAMIPHDPTETLDFEMIRIQKLKALATFKKWDHKF